MCIRDRACRLLCRYLGCRNAGPDFDNLSQKLLVNLRCWLGQQLVQLCIHLQNAAAAGGDLGVGLLLLGAGRGLGQVCLLYTSQEATNSHAYSDNSKDDKYEKWTTIRDARDWTELEK